ncbi:hypothetical protein A7975_00110 [Bacillus sp. FJAT-26390]|nr:hypothetical protein A7975_00110 [Bacillus sp. FJAT-26390]
MASGAALILSSGGNLSVIFTCRSAARHVNDDIFLDGDHASVDGVQVWIDPASRRNSEREHGSGRWKAVRLVAVYIAMMIGVSLVMMPAQTAGLNQLPRHLYPHGTAILNTLLQVAGAIGTALYISIMANGQKNYLNGSSDPHSPGEIVKALANGINNAFWVGVFIALGVFILGLFLRKAKSPEIKNEGSA